MKYKLYGALMAAAMISAPSFAADCGEQPSDAPNVPNGEIAEAENIRQARVAVVSYSEKVDAYLACMDARGPSILPYLTKEQQVRWDEDLADLHDRRRDVQNAMNLAIRAYRKAERNK